MHCVKRQQLPTIIKEVFFLWFIGWVITCNCLNTSSYGWPASRCEHKQIKDNNDLEEWKQEGRSWRAAASPQSVQQCCRWLSLSQDLNKTTFGMFWTRQWSGTAIPQQKRPEVIEVHHYCCPNTKGSESSQLQTWQGGV